MARRTARIVLQTEIKVASFLHRELPIRLAHRVRDLESMPYMLAQKSVQQVICTFLGRVSGASTPNQMLLYKTSSFLPVATDISTAEQ